MSAFYLTRDTANRWKSAIILRHYAAGTWPSKGCTAELAAVEAAYVRQQPNPTPPAGAA